MSATSSIAAPAMDNAIILALIAAASALGGGFLTYLGVSANARASIATAEAKAEADIAALEAAADARGPEMAKELLAAAKELIGIRNAELDAYKRDLAEHMRANAALRTEVNQMIVQNAQLIAQNAQMAGEMQEMAGEMQEVRGELRAAREEITELDNHVDRLVDALQRNRIEVPKRERLLLPPAIPADDGQ